MGLCCSRIDWKPKDLLFRNYDDSNTEKWIPPISRVKVISVYDGDTITIVARISGKPYQFKCRLARIDCAEIRGSSPGEKKVAIEAKDALSSKIMGKMITLNDIKFEKYGRLLCEIYYKDQNINNWMLTERYAVEYFGKTKKKVDWSRYRQRMP